MKFNKILIIIFSLIGNNIIINYATSTDKAIEICAKCSKSVCVCTRLEFSILPSRSSSSSSVPKVHMAYPETLLTSMSHQDKDRFSRSASAKFIPILKSDLQKRRQAHRLYIYRKILRQLEDSEIDSGSSAPLKGFINIKFDNGNEIEIPFEEIINTDVETLITQDRLNFGDLTNFHKLSSEQISKYKENGYTFGDITKYSYQDILNALTAFTYYSVESYRIGLRQFPFYEKFILSFNHQLKIVPKFREKLLTRIQNGKEVVNFIRLEANRIRIEHRILNRHIRKETPISNDLQDIKSRFENELTYSTNPEIQQKRLAAIEETLKSAEQNSGTYMLSSSADIMREKLNLDKDIFVKKIGTIADHQLHQELINNFNMASELYVKISNESLKGYLEVASIFAAKGIQLNDTQKAAAYACSDASASLINFVVDVWNIFKTNGKEFTYGALNAFKDNATSLIPIESFYHTIKDCSKAIMWCIANAPEHEYEMYHVAPIWITESEKIKDEIVAAKAEEIRQFCNQIVKLVSEMPMEQRSKSIGYIITDLILTKGKSKLLSRALSLKATDLRKIIESGESALNKLGPIGEEIAQVVGHGARKGLTSTEALVDYLGNYPKKVKRTLFKTIDETFKKEKRTVLNIKQSKITASRVTVGLTSARLKFLKDNFVARYPIEKLIEFGKTIPGDGAKRIIAILEDADILNKGTISGAIYEIEKAFQLTKKGEKIVEMGSKLPIINPITNKVLEKCEVDIQTLSKLIECKNITWKNTNISELQKQIGKLKHAAISNNKILEVHFKYAIPFEFVEFRNWLIKNNIKFVEDILISKL